MACSSSDVQPRDAPNKQLDRPYESADHQESQDDFIRIHNSSATVPLRDVPVDRITKCLLDSSLPPPSSFNDIEILPPGRLHSPFLVRRSNGNHHVVSLPPPPGTSLLRSERWSIRSEAVVLQWLSDLAGPGRLMDVAMLSDQDEVLSVFSKDNYKTPHVPEKCRNIRDYLPTFINHGLINVDGRVFYNISSPTKGVAISTKSSPLTVAERNSVDFQTGQLIRRLSLYNSPTRKFGLAVDVLALTIPSQYMKHTFFHNNGTVTKNLGFATWSEAFSRLLESVLQDAEESTITLSYHRIRHQLNRFGHFLARVTRSSLVAIDIGENANILVVDEKDAITKTYLRGDVDDRTISESCLGPPGADERIRVTGLREWSHCIFGDPLIASLFCQHPTSELIRGFYSPLESPESRLRDYPSQPIQDPDHSHVRLLLYECYHSIRTIVKEFYSQQDGNFERQMTGRKRLANALWRLEDLSDVGSPTNIR